MSDEIDVCDNNHSRLYLLDSDKGIYECQCNKLFEAKEIADSES